MTFSAEEGGAGGSRGSRRVEKGRQACCHGGQEEDVPGDMDGSLGVTALSVVGDSKVGATPGGRVEATPGGGLRSISGGQTVGLTRVEVCLAGEGGADISKGCSVVSRGV